MQTPLRFNIGGLYRSVIIDYQQYSWRIRDASKSLKNLRVAEVTKLDMKIEEGKVGA